MANMFNDYFVDIGTNIAESIGGNNNNHLDYMAHINQPNYFPSDQFTVIRLKIIICFSNNYFPSDQFTVIRLKIIICFSNNYFPSYQFTVIRLKIIICFSNPAKSQYNSC